MSPDEVVASGLVEGTEGEDGVEPVDSPPHPGLFRAVGDNGCARGLDVPGTDEPALGRVVGIVHPVRVVGEVSEV